MDTPETPIDYNNPFGMPEYEEGDNPLHEALSKVCKMPEGRALMWAIIGQTKIYSEDFSGNSRDIFDKGRRSVGLWLIAQLTEVDPTVYPRLLLDMANHEQREFKKLADKEQSDDS